ncbi:hypothetical protein SAMN02745823_01589 [Sporobacter termitidis DSM 10068]|uniref:Uncharacterized protein n=1 Tax=Sporobacter termitidis DSM 10068 TaxID=1123282 RepID=A0A1M5X439_9FIRM|nr:hypothetical protein [Sporobacter termitidis]SHH94586.1 hypothetical protein SAMN02745823_01589 [Sporobacter termitidis DSM 10068]
MGYDPMSASSAGIHGRTVRISGNLEGRGNIAANVREPEGARNAPADKTPAPAVSGISSREPVQSAVTAASCANADSAAVLEGYLTLARQSACLRGYMY